LGGYVGGVSSAKPLDVFDFAYWIVPSLSLREYKYVGEVLDSLGGYINMAKTSVEGYSGRLTSRRFEIGAISIYPIEYYYKKEPLTSEVSNEVHGGRIGFNDSVFVEGGYQKFFNRRGLALFYNDGPFFKPTWQWHAKDYDDIKPFDSDDFLTSFTVSGYWSDRYSPFPKLIFTFEFLRALNYVMDFYFSPEFTEFNFGFMVNLKGLYK
jgi:hypothetical protein